MNEKLNLVEILKNAPKGTTLYSSILGDVVFKYIQTGAEYPIVVSAIDSSIESFTEDGRLLKGYNGECTLFPSKDQRDWSKFTAPRCKKKRFDPKTLKAFDKVIVKPDNRDWRCSILSHREDNNIYYRMIDGYGYSHIIPYNDDTKHLLGTTKEAPEFYRYWEDSL